MTVTIRQSLNNTRYHTVYAKAYAYEKYIGYIKRCNDNKWLVSVGLYTPRTQAYFETLETAKTFTIAHLRLTWAINNTK